MVSVVSQAVSMQQTGPSSNIALSGSILLSSTNFQQNFFSGTQITMSESPGPFKKMVVLSRVSKVSTATITNYNINIGNTGSVSQLISISDSTNVLFIHFINSPRIHTGLGSGSDVSVSIGVSGPFQSSSTITVTSFIYALTGGSGPYDLQTGTNSTSHTLTSGEFINDKAAVFAITSGSSITGITTQTTDPVCGGQLIDAGTTLNLSTSGIMASAVFK
jgi:hypothetical protein